MKAPCNCRVGLIRGLLMRFCAKHKWFNLYDWLHGGIAAWYRPPIQEVLSLRKAPKSFYRGF